MNNFKALGVFLLGMGLLLAAVRPQAADAGESLAGTWTLVAADVIHADGSRTRDYGAAPKGLLIVDNEGRYSLQIFKSERAKFASANKQAATPAEYESAVLGSSTHYGKLTADFASSTLTFKIESASFPNWEGQDQVRKFKLEGDELSYSVPPRPDGNTPISVWRRLK
ncbi:lipocalin-like domain-containing protein [Rhodopseudomonas boonkerdii]|uniref:lipocalin-like domain-containing protein n=1 Tax=Rhodopseudomonas boonkerdii TaxID=475937 RepID=UPI001E436605|nr:lipocalin-like domain-containing protein [Rhodopseudomonas boonkerdii]UGV28485.1 lipocalin-like domain-containing protein [Rhodopseudomonas boonkerdii]